MSYFGTCNFIKSAPSFKQIPTHPEHKVAFWGRSNVGKSSLLNTLVGQKIAKVSKTPGRTQLINLFETQSPKLMICDLPGYGYAKLSHQKLDDITHSLEDFFKNSDKLSLLCLLIDARHGLTQTDKNILSLIASLECPVSIVLTKADKNSNNVNKKIIQSVQFDLAEFMLTPPIFCVSSTKKDGIDSLYQSICSIIE